MHLRNTPVIENIDCFLSLTDTNFTQGSRMKNQFCLVNLGGETACFPLSRFS